MKKVCNVFICILIFTIVIIGATIVILKMNKADKKVNIAVEENNNIYSNNNVENDSNVNDSKKDLEVVIKKIKEEIKSKNNSEIIAVIEYEYPQFEGNSSNIDKINKIIENMSKDQIEEFKNEYCSNYLSDNIPFKYENKIFMQSNKNNKYTFGNYTYEEIGGSHPNNIYFYYNFDLDSGNESKITDVLDKTKEEIIDIIIEKIKKETDFTESDVNQYMSKEDVLKNFDKLQFALYTDEGIFCDFSYFVSHGSGECIVYL